MRAQKALLVFVLGLLMLSVSACGFGYYKAIAQPAGPSGQIQQATGFEVLPLDYSAVKYTDLGYDSQYDTDKKDYEAHFKEAFEAEGVPAKKITMIGAGDKPTSGIVVKTVVDRIQLNWNAWSNQADDFFVTITFTDAASGKKLFEGQFQVKNTAFSTAFGTSMVGRLNNAAFNIDWLLAKIMSGGKAQPDQY